VAHFSRKIYKKKEEICQKGVKLDYDKIVQKLKEFNNNRDWDQYHNLKDLAAAIGIEASELQEIFLWKKEEELKDIVNSKRDKIEEEVADIFLFLTMFCYKANIDLEKVSLRKMEKNNLKYPVEKIKGKNNKYTEL
jgi:NTP pyrophosphatase (non-canonical NTP hydrolase)